MEKGWQMVLLDLPGFQRPRDALTERMQRSVNQTLAEVDVILVMLNAAEAIGRETGSWSTRGARDAYAGVSGHQQDRSGE